MASGFQYVTPPMADYPMTSQAPSGRQDPRLSVGAYMNQQLAGLSTRTGSTVGGPSPQRMDPLGPSPVNEQGPSVGSDRASQLYSDINQSNMNLTNYAAATRHRAEAARAAQAAQNQSHFSGPVRQSGASGASGGAALARVQAILPAGARITSTYRTPAENARVGGVANSLHMDRNNPAVDIAGNTGLLDALYRQLQQMGGWRQLLWRVPGHFDHIHVA
jgi:hypothetical protein